jgi:hypothetical protein
VPAIKEEPNSDSEADPLSSNIDLRKVKVGYVKKCVYLNEVCRFGTFQIFIFNVVKIVLNYTVIMLIRIFDCRALVMLSSKLRELTRMEKSF